MASAGRPRGFSLDPPIGSGRVRGLPQSSPSRKIPLLGIAHLVEGKLFQVQGVFGKTTLIRGRF